MSINTLDSKALYFASQQGSQPKSVDPTNTKDPEKLREAARSFEAIFLRQIFNEMYKANDSLAGENKLADGIYRDMLVNNVAELGAKQNSLGIARLLEKQWGLEPENSIKTPEKNSTEWQHTLTHLDGMTDEDMPHLRTWRTPVDGRVSSEYGMRVHPISGDTQMHHGIDIAAAEGTAIHAVAPGRVTFAGERGGYGLFVEIEHDNGFTTRYAHASAIHVEEGQYITPDIIIGEVGQSGRATGPHLHFEVRKNTESIDPRNVVSRLRAKQR